MHARINEDGRVAELIEHEPSGRYHPSIKWIEVPAVLQRWINTHHWIETEDGVSVTPETPAHFTEQMGRVVADRRWEKQITGIIHNGITWHTDNAARATIDQTLALAERYEAVNGAGSWSTDWKALSGWASVDLATLADAAMAMGAYVQACFARERAISDALELAALENNATAESIIAVYDAEIGTGWPDNGIAVPVAE